MSRIKKIFCVLFGHSRIVEFCFGYVTCARCDEQLGDTLAGAYDLSNSVIVGHDCDICRKNYKTLTWRDKFLTPNPFKK